MKAVLFEQVEGLLGGLLVMIVDGGVHVPLHAPGFLPFAAAFDLLGDVRLHLVEQRDLAHEDFVPLGLAAVDEEGDQLVEFVQDRGTAAGQRDWRRRRRGYAAPRAGTGSPRAPLPNRRRWPARPHSRRRPWTRIPGWHPGLSSGEAFFSLAISRPSSRARASASRFLAETRISFFVRRCLSVSRKNDVVRNLSLRKRESDST